MENGMKRVGGLEMSEKGHVENEVLGDKVESGVVVESDDTRDMEEEVFEEASDSQEQFQEVGTESESGANFETAEDSSSVVVDENSAAETFEEAVDIHGDAGIVKDLVDVVVENKVDELVVAETSNKIDEGGTPGEVGNDEPNAGKEVSQNDKANAGKEVSEDFGLAGESKNGESVALEAGDQKAPHFQLESSGEILNESGKKEDLKSDSTGYQENDGLKDPLIEPRESKVDEYKENLDSANEDNDKHLAKNEIGEGFKVQYDSNDIVNDTTVAAHSEGNGEPCQLKPVSAIVEAFSEESVVPEISNPPSSMNLVNEGIKEIHADATNVVGVEERSKDIHVDANNLVEEESSKAIPVGAANVVVEERSKEIHVDATNVVAEEKGEEIRNDANILVAEEKGKEIHNDATILVAEEKGKEIHDDAANLTAEDIKSGPLHADEKVDSVENKNVMIEQLGNKAEKEVRPSEAHSKPKLDSSSGRSASSTNPPARPAGLGRVAPLLEPAPRAVQPPRANGTVSHVQSQQAEDNNNADAEEYDETREKLQMIRVKFLRLAYRLGQTPHNVVVAQVLYRLGLAEQLRGRNGGRVGAFSFDRASAMAEQLEAAGQEPLDFSCTIMVLGKTGVGKSATINSIFDEAKFSTDAFHLGTTKVQDVVGTVQGIKVRVIDTPGLLPSGSDQRHNEKILHSVKCFIKKTPPDIVLYLDRLDMQSRDFGDMPLLRTITEIFGPSIWFNAIVVLTHAASAPPDGPNGTASSYDMFVTQRSHVVQQAIRQAAGDMRLMNPVSLVENHSACRTNRAGQRVLPNGQVWKPHLLLLSFASKILAEANALLKLQDSPPGKPFATRSRAPPLPFLLSSLLQSRPQVKLPEEQFGDDDGLDDDLDEASDSEDESEYDDLPPFRSLTKAQLGKLNKAQKKAYFEELELREKLFMKKQLKEEKRRRKMMKKMAAAAKDLPSEYSESVEEESGGPASVPVPMPDLALPASFDSDNPTHRYRYLDSSNQWLVRPVLETHGWDHDVGYEGINVERLFVVKEKIPISFSGQVTKDKKDSNVQMEFASSLKHGEGKATSLGFDMQTMGKELAYTLRGETRFSNYRKNKATAGLSVTLMGDALSAGVKVEDKLIVNKRFQMVVSGGAMTGRGDVAYGGSLEAQLRDKDYPLGHSLSTLGLSIMDWHGDLAVGCNVQSQIPVGRSTNLIARANLNNRGAGQISVRLNTSEQLQIALLGIVPILQKLFSYPQQVQFGQ